MPDSIEQIVLDLVGRDPWEPAARRLDHDDAWWAEFDAQPLDPADFIDEAAARGDVL